MTDRDHTPAQILPEIAAASPTPAAEAVAVLSPNRHAEAGRLGAKRVHELIREGRLYEKEKGLKPGRQRLRQLIQLGRLYEREHGLAPARPPRRRSAQENWREFVRALGRVVKPAYRGEVERMVKALHEPAA